MPTLLENLDAMRVAGKKPAAGLLFALTWMRGGRGRRAVDDMLAWHARHGRPSWGSVITWAEGHALESEIARPLAEARGMVVPTAAGPAP